MFAVRMLRPLVYSVQYWDANGNLVRGVVSWKQKDELLQALKTLDIPQKDPNFLNVNAGDLAQQLPGINNKVKHPVTGFEESLYSIIIELNDNYKWSREKIADWIETLDDVPKFEVP